MKIIRLLQPAEQEMTEAAWYYESQAPGLSVTFLNHIQLAFDDIAQGPERWPEIKFKIRRRLVYRFPYGVFYRIDPEEVVVLTIANLRRRPNYWSARASDA